MLRPALSFWHPATLVSSWFGAGLLPMAPGTWGSLAALPFAWLISRYAGAPALLAAAAVAFILGWWASAAYMRSSRAEDPQEIVIDEVAAQWLTLTVADPQIWWHWLLGFAFFRLCDIVKPWPANLVDRQRSALAVMGDDAVAGVYALICLTTAAYAGKAFGAL